MPICLMVPDLISYTTQLWRAAEVLPLMWHSLLLKIIGFSATHPPSLALHVSLALSNTHRHFVHVHSGHAQLIDLAHGSAGAGSLLHLGGFRLLFSRVGPRLCLKNRFEQPKQWAEGCHFNMGQGSFCRLEWRLPVSGSAETSGRSGKAYQGFIALPLYQLGWA